MKDNRGERQTENPSSVPFGNDRLRRSSKSLCNSTVQTVRFRVETARDEGMRGKSDILEEQWEGKEIKVERKQG